MRSVHLPAFHTNMGTYSGSVFSTVCCIVATITGIYESTGKHPPTWNLSDAVVMHSILIMQNTSNSFQDPSLRNKIPKAH